MYMPRIHATTKDWRTWLQLIALGALAWGISRSVPYVGPGSLDYIAPRAQSLGILFSITVGFLMYKTLNRRVALDEHIALELNKIRRIHHLAQYLMEAHGHLASWFGQIREGIVEYLRSFEERSFSNYEEGGPLFRSITYPIYSLPSLGKDYNAELYDALLLTTNQATEARERIRLSKNDRIGRFSWFVVIIISLVFSGLIIAATPYESLLRDVGAMVIFCLFLVLQLIHEHDRPNQIRDRGLSAKYLDDLQTIETSLPQKES